MTMMVIGSEVMMMMMMMFWQTHILPIVHHCLRRLFQLPREPVHCDDLDDDDDHADDADDDLNDDDDVDDEDDDDEECRTHQALCLISKKTKSSSMSDQQSAADYQTHYWGHLIICVVYDLLKNILRIGW